MSLVRFISRRIHKSGFLFDLQQRWTNGSYRDMAKAFGRFIGPDQRVLDLGCATGGCARHIWKQTNTRYIGVDFSFQYLRWGSRRHPGAGFICADIGHLPFSSFPFDVVCVFSVLHHVDDRAVRALGTVLAGALAREARVLVAEPVFPPRASARRRIDRLSRFLLEHDRGRHIRDAEAYVSLLGNGLEVVSQWHFLYSIHHFCGFELRRKEG